MNTDMTIVRLLGAVQLLVFGASMLSERMLASAVGAGAISEQLVNIASNLTQMRISNLVALVNSLAIVVLGVLFYGTLNEHHPTLALVALGAFIAEGITLAVSKLGAYGLISLSQEFVQAGAPESSYYQTLGEFLYSGVDRRGYDLHMLFFCVGALLWYYLLYRSQAIPQLLALWGVVAVGLLAIPVILGLYNRAFNDHPVMIVGLLYAPYELVLGLWLLIKGFN